MRIVGTKTELRQSHLTCLVISELLLEFKKQALKTSQEVVVLD